MKAVGNYLVIKQIRAQERESNSGLLKSPEILDRFLRGIIISSSNVGKEHFGLQAGQEVLFDKNAGHQIPDPSGDIVKVVQCTDVAVIL